MNYAIIDIETTGGTKITEISIFIFDGEKVIDEYTTLVNPEAYIPPFITNLTGINSAMVSNSPKFYEIAKKVTEITEDTIFVAHNVNFDYNIIQSEFKELGFDFKRKKLCTIRLSRKLIPGLKSYSLGAICASEKIRIVNQHRARGDAEATTILFEKLLKLDDKGVFESFLNPRSRQATLPPLLSKEVFDGLSEREGIYYFYNTKGDVIYVGKSNNIKQRVQSHFYDKAKKEVAMCLEIANIKFEETGSELVALLLESAKIKHLFPKYNRAQRRAKESIGLFAYEDRKGILHLAYNSLKLVKNPLLKFYNNVSCRQFLENLCESFELCPKYCHLQSNVDNCFHYQIKQCKGICKEEETVEDYNNRVLDAIASIKYNNDNFVINETGRTSEESAFVLITDGVYRGFGYLPVSDAHTPKDYKDALLMQKDNSDIKRILNSYLKNNSDGLQNLGAEFKNINFEENVLSNAFN